MEGIIIEHLAPSTTVIMYDYSLYLLPREDITRYAINLYSNGDGSILIDSSNLGAGFITVYQNLAKNPDTKHLDTVTERIRQIIYNRRIRQTR